MHRQNVFIILTFEVTLFCFCLFVCFLFFFSVSGEDKDPYFVQIPQARQERAGCKECDMDENKFQQYATAYFYFDILLNRPFL